MNSMQRSGHKSSPTVLGLSVQTILRSVSLWLLLSVLGREGKRNILGSMAAIGAGSWGSISGGSGTNWGWQVVSCKHISVLFPPLQHFRLPNHSVSNCIFRRHVQRVLLRRVLTNNLFLMRDSVFTLPVVFRKIYSWLMSRTIIITSSHNGVMRFSSFNCSVPP